MNCTTCGAAMELPESRRFFMCRYCGTFSFPDPVDGDGARVVGYLPYAPLCPVCATTPLTGIALSPCTTMDTKSIFERPA